MRWYSWRFGRLAFTALGMSATEIKDSKGEWKPVIGGFWWLVKRKD